MTVIRRTLRSEEGEEIGTLEVRVDEAKFLRPDGSRPTGAELERRTLEVVRKELGSS